MRYGLFSDVHSNLESFQEVLACIDKEKPNQYVFLGDIVGYNANPNECIQLLKDLVERTGCTCIAGNHDYAVLDYTDTKNFNSYAKHAVEWTKRQLKSSDIQFLTQMKLTHRIGNFTIVHSTLVAPEAWGYVFDMNDAYPNFKILQDQICFIGHSHMPGFFSTGDKIGSSSEAKIIVQKDVKYIVNVGSVGQPRDGDPKASCAIYDTDTSTIKIKRVSYNIKKTQERIIQVGLPDILAERLGIGR
ncbi:MAG: metallophosphatase family protein [Candidatus Omnitrophica bacterium]|nr:metallophosphatase family protein [Candidatus Omnitrophota bacterium]MBU1852740.1 metallophosphatase family protein [Candidatus Omnitrophota bacterium]